MANLKGDGECLPAAEPTDHSLLRRYRRGCQDAATQLYLRYAQRLRGLARAQLSPELACRMDEDDIVQSVFGSFFRRAADGYYDVPVGEELWRLFLVIALHKVRSKSAYNRAAKRDIRKTVSGVDDDAVLDRAWEDDGAAFAFLQLVIEESLQRLTPAQKQMVELRVEGYEVAEIAAKSGRSKRTVERTIQEARKRLGDILEEGG